MMYGLRMSGRTLALDGKKDDRWITTENGNKALIDGKTGEVKAGFGGKFNGRKIDEIHKDEKPKDKKEISQSLKSVIEYVRQKTEGKSKSQLKREHKALTVDQLYGEEVKGIKGQEAVWHLLNLKRGHVKAAFSRNEIGDIDLIWGDPLCGLEHIVRRRIGTRQDIYKILSNISEVISHGKLEQDEDGFVLTGKKQKVIISKGFNQAKGLRLVITACQDLEPVREPNVRIPPI